MLDLGDCQAAGLDDVRDADGRDERGDALREFAVVDQRARAAVGEDVEDLGRREARVDGHEDGAQLRAPEQRREEFGAVLAHEGDAVTLGHSP